MDALRVQCDMLLGEALCYPVVTSQRDGRGIFCDRVSLDPPVELCWVGDKALDDEHPAWFQHPGDGLAAAVMTGH